MRRGRRIATLEAANRALRHQIANQRRRHADTAMQHRLDRALRAVARLRRDNAELAGLLDNASDRLFQAMGYNDAALSRLGVPLPDEPLAEPGRVGS